MPSSISQQERTERLMKDLESVKKQEIISMDPVFKQSLRAHLQDNFADLRNINTAEADTSSWRDALWSFWSQWRTGLTLVPTFLFVLVIVFSVKDMKLEHVQEDFSTAGTMSVKEALVANEFASPDVEISEPVVEPTIETTPPVSTPVVKPVKKVVAKKIVKKAPIVKQPAPIKKSEPAKAPTIDTSVIENRAGMIAQDFSLDTAEVVAMADDSEEESFQSTSAKPSTSAPAAPVVAPNSPVVSQPKSVASSAQTDLYNASQPTKKVRVLNSKPRFSMAHGKRLKKF